MLVPNRHGSSTAYRYGFQGQEKDDELKGEGNSLNYTYRMHDPRVGRFFAVDPLFKEYPYYTPYSFSGNRVIDAVEREGLEPDLFRIQARAGMYGETTQKVVIGIEDGVTESLKGTWNFITRDAWSKKTWKETWSLYTEVADSYSGSNTRQSTPRLDAMAKSFEKNVINGDAYTRSKALSKFSTDILTAYVGSKGLGTLSEFVNATVKTPWGIAKQSKTIGALGGAGKAKSGSTLYRIGTTGKSAEGAAAQFWSLENPLANPEAYAKKYNVPIENIKNADFIETANLKPDANFITREAGSAPGSANTGKGIEVVVEHGGTTNNVITPINK
jgi:RHS repeat-associated protein